MESTKSQPKRKAKSRKQSYGARPVKRKRRSKAEIEKLQSALYSTAKELQPCTVRQLYYQLVSQGLVDKTEQEYKSVGRLLVGMRRSGKLPYHWLADHTRWRYKPNTHDNLESMLDASQQAYRRSLWNSQERHVEIWIEKSALVGVILPITNKWDVGLMPTRGYPSLTFLHESAEEIREINKPTSIYFFGDYDPSGMNISAKVESELRAFAPGVDLVFDRVAVNENQIGEWDLPTRPTKKTDSRCKSFSGESVELDAIPPQKLRDLVTDCIESNIDQRALATTQLVEEAERETLSVMIENMEGAA